MDSVISGNPLYEVVDACRSESDDPFIATKMTETLMTPRPIWKEDEVSVLRSLVELGKNDAEISVALGTRTPAQVSTKRCALKLPTTRPPGRPRTYDLAAVQAIRDRVVAGEHVNSVAADLGLKPRTVYARLRLLTA